MIFIGASIFSTGVICASGTLGQIIPPSIILVLLGDVLSSAYQQAQLSQGIFSPDTVSVGDLFVGAVLPGLLLVILYLMYLVFIAWIKPESMPAVPRYVDVSLSASIKRILRALIPPIALIIAVLGSIIKGVATPTEAASVGATGAILLALFNRRLDCDCLRDVMRKSIRITCMVFMIFIGASIFSLIFAIYVVYHPFRASSKDTITAVNRWVMIIFGVCYAILIIYGYFSLIPTYSPYE